MAFVLVACPHCTNIQQIHHRLQTSFCASCGGKFPATPLSPTYYVGQINRQGYDIIKSDYSIAEDLFRRALQLNPNDFAALIGITLAHQIRIDTIALDKETAMAVGFYLLKKENTGRWELCDEDAAAAAQCCAHLDAAIAHAPDADMKRKLELYRKHNADDALAHVNQIIHNQ